MSVNLGESSRDSLQNVIRAISRLSSKQNALSHREEPQPPQAGAFAFLEQSILAQRFHVVHELVVLCAIFMYRAYALT